MTLKQTLVNMALAGAAAFGIGMCARGEPEPCQVEFDNYKCERYALGWDRLPFFFIKMVTSQR
ncbi:hypothetical protein GOV03_05030 [Candidatus Woesearchaeota archaeon]|nr:hypothetical protein [Candidatus Woesearchaeota archaeon]